MTFEHVEPEYMEKEWPKKKKNPSLNIGNFVQDGRTQK